MKIVCISDMHGNRIVLPDGDMVICAGDMTIFGHTGQIITFLKWFSGLPHKYKIFIAGNHDKLFQKNPALIKSLLLDYPNLIYLEDSAIEIEGVKIYGSPWTPRFMNWAFMYEPSKANKHWDRIPPDTNILITHGPPYGILDLSYYGGVANHAGCKSLLKKLDDLKDLKLHVFGHIHPGRGELYNGKTFINASVMNVDGNLFDLSPIIFNYVV